MDRNHQSKSARTWTALVATAVIILGASGVAQAQAILYGAAHTARTNSSGDPIPGTGPSTLYTINPVTGEATQPRPIQTEPAPGQEPIAFEACSGMDFHPETGVLYATCIRSANDLTRVLITINPATGAGTEVAGINVAEPRFADISFRDNSTLYAYQVSGDDGLVTINLTLGEATRLGPRAGLQFGNGIAFSTAEDVLLHVANPTGTGALGVLNTINPNTGVVLGSESLTFPPCGTGSFLRINAMDFEPGTTNLFASLNGGGQGRGANCLVTIDTSTEPVVVRRVGTDPTVSGLSALAWSPAAAPPEVPSHFECYKAKGKKVRETVKLQDQFGVKDRVRVREPELFCTPVNKNDEGIKNSDGPLTCYEIRDGEDDPKRRIGVKNQFGEQTLKVKGAKLLCAASEVLSVVDGQGHDTDDDDRGDGDDDQD